MENASKALLMAGGVLLALMIIGALLLMFNQISAYQQGDTISQEDSQIAQFNKGFSQYADEKKLKGTDIISLANKVVDNNKKTGTSNYVDYNKKITLEIKLAGFANDYGTNGTTELFGTTTLYSILDQNNAFMKAIKEFSNLEKKYTLSTMGKLKSSYSNISSYVENRPASKTEKQALQESIYTNTGKNITEITKLKDIMRYFEYTELKSAMFKPSALPTYQDGQIVKLTFEYTKK